MQTDAISPELPPPLRLAVLYAPASARPAWRALLGFDHRLSRAVRGASSPLLGQLKLAWWRDRMRSEAREWPAGEPLLAALARFDVERAALESLVDGWEGLLHEEAGEHALRALAGARGNAVAALARTLVCAADLHVIQTLAWRWTNPEAARASARLPRALRPLLILANLPREGTGPASLLRVVRLGLCGR